jgi:NADH-quinone oxidoreductase subunit G
MTIYVRQDRQPEPGEVVEDALLIRADKNPNGTGARARFGAAAFDPAAGHDALLVWGDGDAPAGLDGVRTIRLASFAATAHAMPQPDVLLPIPTHFERDGSFTNFQGRVSRFAQVFARPAGVLDAAEVFAALAAEDAR